MDSTDLTVAILREIRDEIRSTNTKVDSTNARLDQTNSRLDQTNQRLEETREMMEEKFDALGRRIVESEMRTATAITGLTGALDDVRRLLEDRLDLRDRVERCERDIGLLKDRVGI